MAGLLEALFNGGLSTNDIQDEQGAMLADLLRRLDAGQAQSTSVGMTPVIAEHIARRPAPPAWATGIANAAAGLASQAGSQGTQAPPAAPPPPLETRTVEPQPQALPYQAPDAAVAPDVRRNTSPVAAPAPAVRPAASPEPSLGERLSAFGRGYNQGGLVGAVGDMMSGGDSATVRALMTRLNVDRDTARAIAGNPQLGPILFGNRTAPTIVKIPGPYGQEIDMVWNAQSGRLEPLSSLMAPGVQTQPQPQGMVPGAGAAPVPGGSSPAPQTQPPAPPALNLSGQPAAAPPAAAGPVAGAPAPAAPAQPAPASGAPGASGAPPAAQPQQGVGDYVVGNAVPRPPEGYVHRLAPGGQGYLWTRSGQPVFESRAEAEARARLGERRADTAREQQTQIAGVERVIADARRLAEAPGFQQALDLGNLSFPVGIPTPWGYVGGDIFNPVRSAVRAGDRVINGSNQNAAWSVGDEVAAVQQRLNLLVARPLMRGQGAVTDSERQMISDAIGSLGRATDATDYQFRLNSIQRMIEDMNSGQMRPADNYNARPTRDEILSAIDGSRGVYITSRIAELAAKYNVRPYDMTNYVLRMHRTLVGG